MKKLILLILMPLTMSAQTRVNDDVYGERLEKTTFDFNSIPIKNGEIVYEDVSEVPGAKKDSLFRKTKEWLSIQFKSRCHITHESAEAGSITAKIDYPRSEKKSFNLVIDFKDEKYRLRVRDFDNGNDGQRLEQYYENAKIFGGAIGAVSLGKLAKAHGLATNAIQSLKRHLQGTDAF